MISNIHLRMNDIVTLCLGSRNNPGMRVTCVYNAYTGGKVEESFAARGLDVATLAGGED
jgi:hypothetical protein